MDWSTATACSGSFLGAHAGLKRALAQVCVALDQPMTDVNVAPMVKTTTTWIFEPGHTEAAFRARHMMVTWVRGLFKDIHGQMDIDFDNPLASTFFGQIDAPKIKPRIVANDSFVAQKPYQNGAALKAGARVGNEFGFRRTPYQNRANEKG